MASRRLDSQREVRLHARQIRAHYAFPLHSAEMFDLTTPTLSPDIGHKKFISGDFLRWQQDFDPPIFSQYLNTSIRLLLRTSLAPRNRWRTDPSRDQVAFGWASATAMHKRSLPCCVARSHIGEIRSILSGFNVAA